MFSDARQTKLIHLKWQKLQLFCCYYSIRGGWVRGAGALGYLRVHNGRYCLFISDTLTVQRGVEKKNTHIQKQPDSYVELVMNYRSDGLLASRWQ